MDVSAVSGCDGAGAMEKQRNTAYSYFYSQRLLFPCVGVHCLPEIFTYDLKLPIPAKPMDQGD